MTEPLKSVRIGIEAGRGVSWQGISPALAEHAMHLRRPSCKGRLHTVHLQAENLTMQIKVDAGGQETGWEISCEAAATALRILATLQHTDILHIAEAGSGERDKSGIFRGSGALPSGFIDRLMAATQ